MHRASWAVNRKQTVPLYPLPFDLGPAVLVLAWRCRYIHPASVIAKQKPDLVVFHELIRGKKKLYMKGTVRGLCSYLPVVSTNALCERLHKKSVSVRVVCAQASLCFGTMRVMPAAVCIE